MRNAPKSNEMTRKLKYYFDVITTTILTRPNRLEAELKKVKEKHNLE